MGELKEIGIEAIELLRFVISSSRYGQYRLLYQEMFRGHF